tara:strand:+ start:176 stop:781 length:606 start_codon:yes stop_codon:yes gene_type:complete
MEGYIYLGEYYDLMGREFPLSDKKIGKSINPVDRENQLNRTKSPIGYKIITVFKVDQMDKVEKMLHAILDSRRLHGEWFKDDEDTLTGEFINFMNIYGATSAQLTDLKEEIIQVTDVRLVTIANSFGKDTMLVRTYKGIDYEVLLDKNGLLHFNGEIFDTPNKFYNRGIIKLLTGKRGNSGTNQVTQFKLKETGESLREPQ